MIPITEYVKLLLLDIACQTAMFLTVGLFCKELLADYYHAAFLPVSSKRSLLRKAVFVSNAWGEPCQVRQKKRSEYPKG